MKRNKYPKLDEFDIQSPPLTVEEATFLSEVIKKNEGAAKKNKEKGF